MSSHELLFVHHSFSGDVNLRKKQRRVVHSNAARAAHAEARRHRMIKYQASKTKERSQPVVIEPEPDLNLAPKIVRLLPAGRKDPFMCFVRPFKPVEHFLLDHYMQSVVPLLRCHGAASFYEERMTRAWVPLALTDAGLLDSLFLMACRHLSGKYEEEHPKRFAELCVQYKLDCLRSLREAISAKTSFDDATVAKTVMLAYDELAVSDLIMAKHHLDGAVKMVSLNGGPQTLGLDGFIGRLISNLLDKFQGNIFKPVEI